uniref:Uncharacterized protein n=1 Tax=Arundo donax TaxID=35708 RepID=A0A0A9FB38_ARUDO
MTSLFNTISSQMTNYVRNNIPTEMLCQVSTTTRDYHIILT